MKTFRLGVVMFLSAALSSTSLAQAISKTIESKDIPGLAAIAARAGDAPEALLASGILASLRGQDEQAERILAPIAAKADLADEIRGEAFGGLSDVFARQGRYRDAASAMESAQALKPSSDDKGRTSRLQSLRFMQALAGVPPMQASVPNDGQSKLSRDFAKLPRTQITVNGRQQEAVVDTGAGYSTVAESVAQKLGLRFLDGTVSVGSGSSASTPARLAIAQTLQIGGGQFQDVVFIVLPDSALSFMGGLYRIPAIVGFPVLRQLGRLEFRKARGAETLHFSKSSRGWSDQSNLMLDGLRPIVTASIGGHQLLMAIDTGANRTYLSQRAGSEFPSLILGSSSKKRVIESPGGIASESESVTVATLTVTVGGKSVPLRDVRVGGLGAVKEHGLVGQDIMRSGVGYVIDFDAMRFEVLS